MKHPDVIGRQNILSANRGLRLPKGCGIKVRFEICCRQGRKEMKHTKMRSKIGMDVNHNLLLVYKYDRLNGKGDQDVDASNYRIFRQP